MANIKSAAKRARQTVRRTLRNKSILTGIRSQQKNLAAALTSGDSPRAAAALQVLASRLDKAAKRRVVSRNLADRRKSRASKAVSALATQVVPSAPESTPVA